jgi:hypothetical protein
LKQSRSIEASIKRTVAAIMKDFAISRIDQALEGLPASLLSRSGSIFYTGREAFASTRPLYLLGLNPGGDPARQSSETVGRHIEGFRTRRQPWSAYADESWQGAAPGSWGMQPRILHLLRGLNLDPHTTPASNVVFARTRDERSLESEKAELLATCWPVHQAVIETLGVGVVVCLGGTAGRWVREKLDADELVDGFREASARGWTSRVHRSSSGLIVVTVTHPGRANWCNSAADPAPLVGRWLST